MVVRILRQKGALLGRGLVQVNQHDAHYLMKTTYGLCCGSDAVFCHITLTSHYQLDSTCHLCTKLDVLSFTASPILEMEVP